MSETAIILSVVYGICAVLWGYIFFRDWFDDWRNPYGPGTHRVWNARLALLAPVWPLPLAYIVFCGLVELWHPPSVGRLIGDFVHDVLGRGNDD